MSSFCALLHCPSPPSQIVWTALSTVHHAGLTDATVSQEVVVSYLPLSHIAAQMVDIWIPMRVGGLTHFAQPDALKVRAERILADARVRPPTASEITCALLCLLLPGLAAEHHEGGSSHGLLGRPTSVGEDAGEDEGGRRQVFDCAQEGFGLGQRRGPAQQSGQDEPVRSCWGSSVAITDVMLVLNGFRLPRRGAAGQTSLSYQIAKKLVFKKVRKALGLDRCTRCYTGAAPITKDTLEFFLSLDIPLYELYGMSESSGPHTISLPEAFRLTRLVRCFRGTNAGEYWAPLQDVLSPKAAAS